MNKIKMNIWGRVFDLKIIFECYGTQVPTPGQEETIRRFSEDIINKCLQQVKDYCLKDENMNGETDISNIFKYVIPTSLYVMRNLNNREIALVCDYRFDIEHGLAIIFENEHYKGIVSQSEL